MEIHVHVHVGANVQKPKLMYTDRLILPCIASRSSIPTEVHVLFRDWTPPVARGERGGEMNSK